METKRSAEADEPVKKKLKLLEWIRKIDCIQTYALSLLLNKIKQFVQYQYNFTGRNSCNQFKNILAVSKYR
jgi:hypothetical protein